MKPYLLFYVLVAMFLTNCPNVLAKTTIQAPTVQHQFEPNFKDKYKGKKYDYEGKSNVKNELVPIDVKGSKYQKETPDLKEENIEDNPSFNLSFLNYVFIFVLVAAFIYLVYILFNEGSSGLFASRNQQRLNSFGELTSENIENIDIQTLIDNAENSEDFRLAIRYHYLLVLKTLSSKNFITFEEDKTNAEYLNEISHLKFSNHFAHTSYLYNYIWYGEFPVNADQYRIAKQRFRTLLNQVT